MTLKAGAAGSFKVTPSMIGDSITFVAADGTLKPQLDAEKLRKVADDAVSKVELKKPKNATVRLVDGKPKVIAAVNGTTLSAANLAAAVEPVLTKTGKERTGDVELTGAKASFSTEDAEQLGITKVTGQFTTQFPYATYRNVNIGRAAELINNTVLKPGDTFSLNGIVGERTAKNGFVEGYIIQGGKFKKELGGGVSQSATTTYNAMFFAGLKDIQHQPHTLYIDRYPPGREATVAWPTLDLKFQNNTKYGVLVQAYVKKATPSSQGSITVKMWSTKTYDEIDVLAAEEVQLHHRPEHHRRRPEVRAPGPGPGLHGQLLPDLPQRRQGREDRAVPLDLRPDGPHHLQVGLRVGTAKPTVVGNRTPSAVAAGRTGRGRNVASEPPGGGTDRYRLGHTDLLAGVGEDVAEAVDDLVQQGGVGDQRRGDLHDRVAAVVGAGDQARPRGTAGAGSRGSAGRAAPGRAGCRRRPRPSRPPRRSRPRGRHRRSAATAARSSGTPGAGPAPGRSPAPGRARRSRCS